MSLQNEQIKNELAVFAGKYAPAILITATVKEIHDDDTVTVVFADDTQAEDVRLKAVVIDGNKCICVPAVNSKVLVGKINNGDDYAVVSFSAISEIKTVIGTVEYGADATGFVFKKGNDTLKQILQLIIESVQQVMVLYGNNPDYAKLATALTKLNNLLK
mgnify:CR=1 FL=1